MKTKIIKIKGDWQEVVNDCRATVGKDELGKDPSVAFKKSILISEHSPIRDIHVKWIWNDIKSWIATHWSRHKWECFIKTQRPDRTGAQRGGPDTPVTFTGDANVQHLIDTMRKRLCNMASKETKEYAKDLKKTLREIEPEISDVLVPNCIYRCGCPELGGCKWYETVCAAEPKIASTNIQERYDAYNRMFHNG